MLAEVETCAQDKVHCLALPILIMDTPILTKLHSTRRVQQFALYGLRKITQTMSVPKISP